MFICMRLQVVNIRSTLDFSPSQEQLRTVTVVKKILVNILSAIRSYVFKAEVKIMICDVMRLMRN